MSVRGIRFHEITGGFDCWHDRMKMDDIVIEYKRWGLRKFLYACMLRALSPWLFFCAVERRPLVTNPQLPVLAPGRSVRDATRQELESLVDDPVYETTKSFIRDAIGCGAHCVAVFQGDKIIAYSWRAYSTAPHVEGLWVEVSPKHRYGFKAFTHPDYRRQQLHHTISLKSDADSIRRGCTHSIGFIETHNYPSLLSNAKRGNKRVGYAGYVRVHGRFFTFRTRGAKQHGFRFFIPPAQH